MSFQECFYLNIHNVCTKEWRTFVRQGRVGQVEVQQRFNMSSQ